MEKIIYYHACMTIEDYDDDHLNDDDNDHEIGTQKPSEGVSRIQEEKFSGSNVSPSGPRSWEIPAVVQVAAVAGTSLAPVLITWMKQRRSDVRIKVTDKQGKVFEVEGNRLLNPEKYTKELLDRINSSKSAEIIVPPERKGGYFARLRKEKQARATENSEGPGSQGVQ